jgi:hypothetical protein
MEITESGHHFVGKKHPQFLGDVIASGKTKFQVCRESGNIIWLVVWTILKNISQREGLSHMKWKVIKAMFETTNQ